MTKRFDIETRVGHGKVEVRSVDDSAPVVVGYAAVFNTLSEDLGGFREMIIPGAFDRAVSERQDVRALVDHAPGRILGRTKAGTLTLSVDEHGLRAEITPPQTNAAAEVMEAIRRGDVDGMSFAFRVRTDLWRTEDGTDIREVRDLDLFDVSVVTYPAYPATEVALRSLATHRATTGGTLSAKRQKYMRAKLPY